MGKTVDIHLHIIPGLDDGAGDIIESLEMLKLAVDQGADAIIATPHSIAFRNNMDFIVRENYADLVSEARKYYPGVEIRLGSEVYCRRKNVMECIDLLDRGVYPTMNGTRYVLTEFSPYYINKEEAVFCTRSLLGAGYLPIIAHAERYGLNLEDIRALKEEGALIQINVYSVEKETEQRINNLANQLLKERLADMAGSDGHSMTHRRPYLKTEVLYERYPADYVDRITYGNAMELLIGE